ncbi:MAG: hypothetical protein WD178_08785, partial [Actinomycetota bacterium]
QPAPPACRRKVLMDESLPELVTIRLIGIPLDLQSSASEHQDGLRREFRMLVEEGQADSASVPGRLITLAADLDRRFQAFGAAGRAELEAAVARGESSVDLTLEVPPAIAPAARNFGDLLEEADEYCSAGEHLLTLRTPPEVAAYRNWVLDELVRQVEGKEPISWPEFRAWFKGEQAGV